jgi:hypothetical protein
MVPRDVTIAVVEEELAAMRAYGGRHGWTVDWRPVVLVLLADGTHPDRSPVRLHADVAGYRAQPPAWRFIPPGSESPEPYRFPKSESLPGGIGSIFHSSKVICAPFNRLAFKDHDGPHQDWGGPTAWLDVRGNVRANALAQMLAIITAHLHHSPGWNE